MASCDDRIPSSSEPQTSNDASIEPSSTEHASTEPDGQLAEPLAPQDSATRRREVEGLVARACGSKDLAAEALTACEEHEADVNGWGAPCYILYVTTDRKPRR